MRNIHVASVFLHFDLDEGPGCMLVKHKRLNLWLPVGGEAEPDERPIDCAIRETEEETGIELTFDCFPNINPCPGAPPGLIGFGEYNIGVKEGESTNHLNFIFVARSPTQDIKLCDEHSAFTWFPLKDKLPLSLETTSNVRWCWEVLGGRQPSNLFWAGLGIVL